MCNALHIDSIPIPTEGTGWKIFYHDSNDDTLRTMCGEISYNGNPYEGVNYWPDVFNNREGFCFFLTRAEGEKVLRKWIKADELHVQKHRCYCVLKQIRYERGIGKHREFGIFGFLHPPHKIALCKFFQVLKEKE